MGFFYAKADRKPQGSVTQSGSGGGSRGKIELLNRLGCKACPLNKADVHTPKMKPTIPRETIVYMLAEAPGKDEDRVSGSPLTGPSGQLLRECIPSNMTEYCAYDNVVRNRPPENRTPTWIEQECCRLYVTASIEAAKPKLIVGLGAVPLNWMLGTSDLSGMRGRLFVVRVGTHTCWFMPTYHPSFILRIAYNKRNPLRSKMGFCFRMDIQRAFDRVDGLLKPHVPTSDEAKSDIEIFSGGPGQLQNVISHFNAAMHAPLSAIDFETNALRPFFADARILACSISYMEGETQRTFSLAMDHKDAKWSTSERARILEALTLYAKCSKTKRVVHNVPFEIEWLIKYSGHQIVTHNGWEDTMMQAHFIDERRGEKKSNKEEFRTTTYQSLGFLTRQYFGVDIKKLFNLDKAKLSTANLDEVLTYCGVDTKWTLRLYKRQHRELKRLGLVDAYRVAIKRQPTVALMQSLGVNIDQKEIKKHQIRLQSEIDDLQEQINNQKVIKQFVKDNGSSATREYPQRHFNPHSQPDVLRVFKDYLGRKEIMVANKGNDGVHGYGKPVQAKRRGDDRGKTYRLTVDKNVLEKIDHPLAELIVGIRNRQKLKSTYVDCLEYNADPKLRGGAIHEDGICHTQFNSTFTETGRTSSDGPNLQNFDKRKNPWIRSSIIPPKNHKIVAIDYGQLEYCTTAICSNDKVIVDSIWNDYDVHRDWAIRIAKRYPSLINGIENINDDEMLNKFRSAVKNKWVFPSIFAASTESVAGYMKMPIEVVEELMDEFNDEFDGLRKWQTDVMKNYWKTGFVESPTKRRRNYPLSMNQCVNHAIQSVACDIVCDPMVRLSELSVRTQEWHFHPRLNIHDDLSFYIPDSPGIMSDAIERIVYHMLTPEFDFINVPLSVEVSVGNNWYELEKLGKFSSKEL